MFVSATDLTGDLDKDPLGTLYRLSSTPSDFGEVKPVLPPAERLTRHQQLLTAAKAYLVHTRKMDADVLEQLDLGLPRVPELPHL
ncbi:MAG: hypothetical protein H6922_00505 [Pseudomonadaceae bacterium]|nr:hypothetical protein [Pseudomonadaceae bacterium]